MIVCQTCGEHNAPNAEFCGNCGDFLKWTGAQVQAGPVRPDAAPQQPPQHHRPQQTARRQVQPGDLICGQCGSGNVPTRKFCGVCGHSLHDAVTQKRPWWKRWLPTRGPKVRERGSRPRRTSRAAQVRQGIGRAFRWVLALAVLLFATLYGFSEGFRSNVNTEVIGVKDSVAGLFGDPVPVRQSSISATRELPDHPAGLAMDNDPSTFWAAQTDPNTAALTITFDHATDLRRMIIHSGDGKKFLGTARPQRLTLVFDTGKTDDIKLIDKPEQQQHAIKDGDGVRQVQILIAGTYPSTESTDTVISEIELFEKQVN
ncbi:zinc ribbon domain-containing protein [Lentzea alba]|uniref:NADase-type glycan-binding domain-containing protein n=1 Tax=Lentzea alba TaxID=2714351 RepID=UPI0039BFADFB